MSQQLRISDDLYTTASEEAPRMHRKVGSQIEHWARLGRLLEKSTSYQNVLAFLSGALTIDKLSALEHALVMDSITDDVEAFSTSGGMKRHLALQHAGSPRTSEE